MLLKDVPFTDRLTRSVHEQAVLEGFSQGQDGRDESYLRMLR